MGNKIMISVLTIALVLMLTSVTFAKPLNTFSINIMPGGEAEVKGFDYDLSQFSVGLTVPINNKLEFNGELYNGEIDTNHGGDTTSFKLKGDYRIFEDRKLRLDFAGGIYHRNLDLDDYKINSLFIGIDGRLILSKQLSVYSGLSIGLLPKEESNGRKGDPDSLYLFHLKFNYLLNSRFGLSVGYANESFNSELLYDDSYYKGFNAGVFFRF
jgi:hypothetical protein